MSERAKFGTWSQWMAPADQNNASFLHATYTDPEDLGVPRHTLDVVHERGLSNDIERAYG